MRAINCTLVRISLRTVVVIAWTSMPLAWVGSTCAQESRVCLDRSEQFSVEFEEAHFESHWKREVMRQALLLAARAEMNLGTSDSTLGESVGPDDERSLQLTCTAGNINRLQLLRGERGKRNSVWAHEFKDDLPWPQHRLWIQQMESLSRSGFCEGLEKAGFKRRAGPTPKEPGAPLDEQLAAAIESDISFPTQFFALRQLHAAIDKDGETPARLAGLIRAYAHLGLLTEHLWHPMSYACKARAALYAQRWAAREPNSYAALLHRGYAFALLGMHSDALADFSAAAKLTNAANAQPPKWLPLLDSFCHYDYDKLNHARTDEQLKSLASLLYFLVYEHEGSRNLIATKGLELLQEMPDCYRMLDTLSHHTGPGAGHVTTQVGPMTLATTLLPRLAQIDNLPANVREALNNAKAEGAFLNADSKEEDLGKEVAHRAKVVLALRTAESTAGGAPAASAAEPNLSVLAHMIEETTFQQVYRRAFFVRVQLAVPVDDFLDAYDPITTSHRYAVLLTQFRGRPDQARLAAAVKGFDLTDNSMAHSPLWVRWPGELRTPVQNAARLHMDGLPNEHGLAARSYPLTSCREHGSMLAVSPHSPFEMAVALHLNANPDPKAEAEWEKSAARSPQLARAFAMVWTKRADLVKAERFLKLSTQLDPSPENFRSLAAHFKSQGRDEEWLNALNECLQAPSLGLQHAEIQCEIAKYYAEKREWDKALPYANEAGQTGAQWAMSWARVANEVNQNWDAAERMHVAAIQRYGEDPLIWYFYCQRTGTGHLDLARQTAFPTGVEQLAKRTDLPSSYLAMALWLEGEREQALEMTEKDAKAAPSSWTALNAAVMADRLNAGARRDALLKQVVDQPPAAAHKSDARPHREELVTLARALIADLAAGGKGDLKLADLHAARDRAPERDRCSFNYFLACYLEHHGKTEPAVYYWKQCMAAQDLVMSARTAAGFELHKRGVKPAEWKQLLFAKRDATK